MGEQEEMKDKAVFFATSSMLQGDDSTEDFSATINVEEWKALRLLTLAGYTIVLFTPDKATVYAECYEPHWTAGVQEPAPREITRNPTKKVAPLLQASASLEVNLEDSWFVGDMLDTIEVGRLAGCKTMLLTAGHETEWDMTVMRWPDLIAGDIWEIACLIVMSDGSSVEGLSASLDDEE
jgi:ribonucleotide monophosphatase NagD (HAD superfamily)